jgi:hypothetical protein
MPKVGSSSVPRHADCAPCSEVCRFIVLVRDARSVEVGLEALQAVKVAALLNVTEEIGWSSLLLKLAGGLGTFFVQPYLGLLQGLFLLQRVQR